MKIKFEMSEESFRAFWDKIRDLSYELAVHRKAFEVLDKEFREMPPAVHALLESRLRYARNLPSLWKSYRQEFDGTVAQLLAAYQETGEPIDLEEYSKPFLAAVKNTLPH